MKYLSQKAQRNYSEQEKFLRQKNPRLFDSIDPIIEENGSECQSDMNQASTAQRHILFDGNDLKELNSINTIVDQNSYELQLIEEDDLTYKEKDLQEEVLMIKKDQILVTKQKNQSNSQKKDFGQPMDIESSEGDEFSRSKAQNHNSKKTQYRPFDYDDIIGLRIYDYIIDLRIQDRNDQSIREVETIFEGHRKLNQAIDLVERDQQEQRQPSQGSSRSDQEEKNSSEFRHKKRNRHRAVKTPYRGFLAFGQKVHFDFLKNLFGSEYIKKHKLLGKLQNQNNMYRDDYLNIYKIQELKWAWKKFFRTKELYRGLMVSRVTNKYKPYFLKQLDRFEEAFKTKIFDYIEKPKSDLIKPNSNKQKNLGQ